MPARIQKHGSFVIKILHSFKFVPKVKALSAIGTLISSFVMEDVAQLIQSLKALSLFVNSSPPSIIIVGLKKMYLSNSKFKYNN